jgi:hypothetical protein
VLFVRDGETSNGERWVTIAAWNAWVAEVKAAPVKPEQPEALWSDEGECQSP